MLILREIHQLRYDEIADSLSGCGHREIPDQPGPETAAEFFAEKRELFSAAGV
ncbi:MAG: hypothetical protein ACLTYN_09700 [Dysosmobacter welbionis]